VGVNSGVAEGVAVAVGVANTDGSRTGTQPT
jgi:hypothetical protein